MSKMRVYELARSLNVSSKQLMELLAEMGRDIKNHMGVLEDYEVDKLKVLVAVPQPEAKSAKAAGAKPAAVEKPQDVKPAEEAQTEKPAASARKPATKPLAEPEVAATPEPAAPAASKPVAPAEPPAPQPVAQQPRPAAPQPVAQQPRPAAPQPVAQQPRPAAPQPVSHQPRPAAPQPVAHQRPAGPAAPPAVSHQRPSGPSGQHRPGGPSKPGSHNRPGGNKKGSDRGGNRNRDRGRDDQRGGVSTLAQSATAVAVPEAEKHVKVYGGIMVKELAERLGVRETELIKKLFMKGIVATINQSLQPETAEMVATEFGFIVEFVSQAEIEDQHFSQDVDDPSRLLSRPPVVTIMGHVDHGKTSLLDAIRSTNVTGGEAGGITQRIGAYHVDVKDRQIVFLDTPGHEAFTAMRARGAKVTDIAILVVAADDGIMPQTIEAIDHAKAAKVPIIVAINKIDKPEANPDRVKQQLAEHGLVPEEWGGETVLVPVSAKKHIGLEELMEMILLVAEIADLKANPDKPGHGVIIESQLDRGKGAVATVLIQTGSVNIGDNFVVGAIAGKVRAMINDRGKRVKKAGPSMPVEISGLPSVPVAGDTFHVCKNEREAKQIAEQRSLIDRSTTMKPTRHVNLENVFSQIKEGKLKELNLVIKADMQGSVEALQQSLTRLSNEQVEVRVIHGGVGDVSESDVLLASASDAPVIAFNVKIDPNAKKLAGTEDVDLRAYSIIYKVIEDVENALAGLFEPEMEEVTTGVAEVRMVIKTSKAGNVAGCIVQSGKIMRNTGARLIRGTEVIHTGRIDSLKRFKEDVREVAAGYECGISFDKFNDVIIGDRIEAFANQPKKR